VRPDKRKISSQTKASTPRLEYSLLFVTFAYCASLMVTVAALPGSSCTSCVVLQFPVCGPLQTYHGL
jgi:hypothetical protein